MTINVSVQYNGGLLPAVILLTQCYYHRGTCLNVMKRFCLCSLCIPPKRFDIFPPLTAGCSEGLDAFIFFFEHPNTNKKNKQKISIHDMKDKS